MKTNLFIYLMLLVMTAGSARAEVFIYTDETAYLTALAASGYSSFSESFEDDIVWEIARSPVSAVSIESLGILWTSNHLATNTITTGIGAAVTGDWGIYDPDHGVATATKEDCQVEILPPECLFHDGFSGTRVAGESTLYAVGGWFYGTFGAKIQFIFDQADLVKFDTLIGSPTLQPQFFGIIKTEGFTKYEIREAGGKVGQEKYIFADDFTFAISTSCTPIGFSDNNCDGIDDDCNGAIDDGYVPDTSCGIGICGTNNIPSSCSGGVETTCQEGLPDFEDTVDTCTDTLDNDCDGLTDILDSDCSSVCIPTGLPDTNCDGIDDDCNGEIDDASPNCQAEQNFSWTLFLPAILNVSINRDK